MSGFFGHKQELAQAADHLGRPSGHVLVSGPHGIGKTAFLKQVVGSSQVLWISLEWRHSTGEFVGRFAQALASFIAASDGDGKALSTAIRDSLSGCGTWSSELVTALRAVLNANKSTAKLANLFPKTDPSQRPTIDDEPQRVRDLAHALCNAVGALQQATGKPVTIAIDGVEQLPTHLTHALAPAIADHRDAANPHWCLTLNTSLMPPAWAGQLARHLGNALHVELQPLDRTAVEAWLHNASAEVSGSQAKSLLRASRGNPRAIESLLASRKADSNFTPYEELIGNRINAFDPEIRRFLRQLSVLNSPRRPAACAALTKFDESQVTGFIGELKAQNILQETPLGPWFTSPQLRHLIADTIMSSVRKKYFEDLVGFLEDHHASALRSLAADDLGLIDLYARGLFRALDYRRSLEFLMRVGHTWFDLGGWWEADRCLSQAAEAADMLGFDEDAHSLRGNALLARTALTPDDASFAEHRKLVDHFRMQNDDGNQLRSLYHMGVAGLREGRYAEAKSALTASLRLGKDVLNGKELLATELLLGEAILRRRETSDLAELLNGCQERCEQHGGRFQAALYDLQAGLARLEKRHSEAISQAKAASEIWQALGHSEFATTSLFEAWLAAHDSGDTTQRAALTASLQVHGGGLAAIATWAESGEDTEQMDAIPADLRPLARALAPGGASESDTETLDQQARFFAGRHLASLAATTRYSYALADLDGRNESWSANGLTSAASGLEKAGEPDAAAVAMALASLISPDIDQPAADTVTASEARLSLEVIGLLTGEAKPQAIRQTLANYEELTPADKLDHELITRLGLLSGDVKKAQASLVHWQPAEGSVEEARKSLLQAIVLCQVADDGDKLAKAAKLLHTARSWLDERGAEALADLVAPVASMLGGEDASETTDEDAHPLLAGVVAQRAGNREDARHQFSRAAQNARNDHERLLANLRLFALDQADLNYERCYLHCDAIASGVPNGDAIADELRQRLQTEMGTALYEELRAASQTIPNTKNT